MNPAQICFTGDGGIQSGVPVTCMYWPMSSSGIVSGVCGRAMSNGSTGYRSSSVVATCSFHPARLIRFESAAALTVMAVSTRPMPSGGDWTDMFPDAR